MQLFLGDVVTLVKESNQPTFVTGQVNGIVLDNNARPERIYIVGINTPFWMSEGWMFQIDENDDD
jgi:hypothetical protein